MTAGLPQTISRFSDIVCSLECASAASCTYRRALQCDFLIRIAAGFTIEEAGSSYSCHQVFPLSTKALQDFLRIVLGTTCSENDWQPYIVKSASNNVQRSSFHLAVFSQFSFQVPHASCLSRLLMRASGGMWHTGRGRIRAFDSVSHASGVDGVDSSPECHVHFRDGQEMVATISEAIYPPLVSIRDGGNQSLSSVPKTSVKRAFFF